MESKEVHDVSHRTRYVFKKHPFVSFLNNPIDAFSKVLDNVLHVKNIHSYIHWKIESIGDFEIHMGLEKMCNNDLTLKSAYASLNRSLIIMNGPKLF